MTEHADDNKHKRRRKTLTDNSTTSSDIDVSNIEGCETRQDEQTLIPIKTAGTKKYICIFCHKMQAKIARHLESVHSNESEVQKVHIFTKRL